MKKFIPAALLSFLNRCWQLLLVLILLLVLLSINLDKVRWFSNNPPPTDLIWLGAVLGAVVAFSRFSNLSCQLYLLLSGLLAVLQTSHGLLSGMNDLAGMNFWSFSDSIRLHLHLFYLQFISGWQGSFHGYLVLCLLFWICGAWLVWATIRIKRPLAGIIPAACMLGYESNLKNHNLGTMAIFVFFVVLLASAASFREQHDDWEKRNISTPWELGDWPFSALVIAALAATFTLTIPYVATQEGRREISDFLKPEPQKIQISNYTASRPETSGEQITIADFDLQDPGKPPSRSTVTVMLLRLNDSPPVESGPEIWNDANQRYYLRSSLFTTYTGSGWKIEEVQEKPALEEAGPGRRLLVQEIEILVNHEGRLFAANLPISSGQGTYLSAATPDGSPLLSGQGNTYTVQSLVSDLQNEELEKAGSDYPPQILQTYLQLPQDLPETISLLAGEITHSALTPLQKTLAVQNFLQKEYLYDLDTPPPAAGQDMVEYFLFHAKRGFCTYYASAMAVLLRSSGVPTRLAAGYTAWQYDPGRELYIIPASAAHAWVEVYFPGYGWVEFEPTPIHPQLLYEGNETSLQITEQETSESASKKISPILVFSGILSGAILLVLLAVCLIRAAARQKHAGDSPAARFYLQIRSTLAQAGLAAPASITPNEFLQMASAQLETYPGLAAALQEATIVYNDTLFRPEPPPVQALSAAQRVWRTTMHERWLLIFRKNKQSVKKIISRRRVP